MIPPAPPAPTPATKIILSFPVCDNNYRIYIIVGIFCGVKFLWITANSYRQIAIYNMV